MDRRFEHGLVIGSIIGACWAIVLFTTLAPTSDIRARIGFLAGPTLFAVITFALASLAVLVLLLGGTYSGQALGGAVLALALVTVASATTPLWRWIPEAAPPYGVIAALVTGGIGAVAWLRERSAFLRWRRCTFR